MSTRGRAPLKAAVGCAGELLFMTGCCWPEIGRVGQPPRGTAPDLVDITQMCSTLLEGRVKCRLWPSEAAADRALRFFDSGPVRSNHELAAAATPGSCARRRRRRELIGRVYCGRLARVGERTAGLTSCRCCTVNTEMTQPLAAHSTPTPETPPAAPPEPPPPGPEDPSPAVEDPPAPAHHVPVQEPGRPSPAVR